MKKILWLIILLIMPVNVFAFKFEKATIKIDDRHINTSDVIDIGFVINYSGSVRVVIAGSKPAESVYETVEYISDVEIEFDYNEDIFSIERLTSENYNIKLEEKDDKNYIVLKIKKSKVDEIEKTKKPLIKVTGAISLKVKDTDKTNTEVKFKTTKAKLFDNKEYFESTANLDKKITYIISNIKESENKTSNKKNSNNIEIKKSDNNYLKELVIDGYKIDFKKDKNSYEIKVDNNINKLDIKCKLEDSKSSYEIKGNDNLSENNNRVYVVVKSESGKKNTYVINIKRDKEVVKESTNNKSKIIISVVGIIIGLTIILFIIHKINAHRLDKILNKL